MIIGIAGPTASGKTTVAKMLEEHKEAYRIRYSDILAEIARERDLPTDKATLQNLYLTEREGRGEDFLAKEMEVRVSLLPNPTVVIEGNRRLVDIPVLKQIALNRGEELLLLYIEAPKEVRFARYNSRLQSQGEEPISAEAFEKLETNGAEDELDELRTIFSQEGTVIDASAHTPEEIFEIIETLL